MLINLALMASLSGITWTVFGIWMVAGLVVYFAYSRSHSRIQDPQIT